MEKKLLSLFMFLLNFNAYSTTAIKKCPTMSKADCLHSQGLYTDDELEKMNIESVEVSINEKRAKEIIKTKNEDNSVIARLDEYRLRKNNQ